MAKFVYISEQCERDLARHDLASNAYDLRRTIETQQTLPQVTRYPPPLIKKNLKKKGRLILCEQKLGDDIVYVFLRAIIRGSTDYTAFKEMANSGNGDTFIKRYGPTEVDVRSWLSERKTIDPPEPLRELTESEHLYLYFSGRGPDNQDVMILESSDWVERMDRTVRRELRVRYGDLLQSLVLDSSGSERETVIRDRDDPQYGILYRYYSRHRILFAIAPLDRSQSSSSLSESNGNDDAEVAGQSADETSLRQKYAPVLEHDSFPKEQLLQHGVRSYPSIITLDSDLWLDTQESTDANLALSPEEVGILDDVLNWHEDPTPRAFPLFINGRPGSGKSTVLLYLFAEYLYFHLEQLRNGTNVLSAPPLYLTYSEALLTEGKRIINDILRCDFKKALGNKGLLEDEAVTSEVNRSFGYFRKFLLEMLPSADRESFKQVNYVDFPAFRDWLTAHAHKHPDATLRTLSPEISWHVIRTYIKGMKQGESYFDLEDYALLPQARQTVSNEIFAAVYDYVWISYKDFCDEGQWDDQDLALKVLDLETAGEISISNRPGIFCDEAQDFTTVELQLIYRISLYSKCNVQANSLSRVPFAFAGDPFQTLNPTGFNWDVTQANFHDNIVQQLDAGSGAKLQFNFRELAFNYRSAKPIVQFCNLVQLMRGRGFGIKSLKPQVTWQVQEANDPRYFSDSDPAARQALRNEAGLIIIVPCQEGDEEQYVKGDTFLSQIAWNSEDEIISRDVLSPMRAKGLQFKRIVLYKFGEYALKEYGATLSAFFDGTAATLPRRELLPLEYFINGLYVAASRPRQRLLIVDTDAALSKFWDFAINPDFDSLIDSYGCNFEWSAADLTRIRPGDKSSWLDSRDDPRQVADDFMAKGRARRDAYDIERARQNYEAAGDEDSALEARALSLQFGGKFKEAGDIYRNMRRQEDAVDCYWRAQVYGEIVNMAATGGAQFDPRYRAAAFMEGVRDFRATELFLKEVNDSVHSGEHNSIVTDPQWATILEAAIHSVSESVGDDQHEKSDARRVLAYLRQIEDAGVVIVRSIDFAHIAAVAGEESLSRDIVLASGLSIDPMPDWLTVVMARTEEYPDSLRYLEALGQSDEIVGQYEANVSTALSLKQEQLVFESYVNRNDLPGAHELAAATGQHEMTASLLRNCALKGWTDLGNRVALTLVDQLVQQGMWKEAVSLVTLGDLTSLGIERDVLDGVRLEVRPLRSRLVELVARAEQLQSESDKVRSRVAQFVRKYALPANGEFVELAYAQLTSAAMERVEPKIITLLKHYEGLTQSSVRDVAQFGRERWLLAKLRQSSLRSSRSENHKAEVKAFAKRWNLPVPKSGDARIQLPPLVPLDNFHVEEDPNSSLEPAIQSDGDSTRGRNDSDSSREALSKRSVVRPTQDEDANTSPKRAYGTPADDLDTTERNNKGPRTFETAADSPGTSKTSVIRSWHCSIGGLVLDGVHTPQHGAFEISEERTGSKIVVRSHGADVIDLYDSLEVERRDDNVWAVNGWNVTCSIEKIGDYAILSVVHADAKHPLLHVAL